MKISVLCENTSCNEDIIAEHGLSLFIETKTHKILFDMGKSDVFLKNAERMGIDLCSVDVAVISHGHYDHGGGLTTFLKVNKTAPVYINKNAFGDYYNAENKYIGLDKEIMSSHRLILTDNECVIDGELSLFSCNEKKRSFVTDTYGLTELHGGASVPDNFLHEQYLLIKEDGKRVLVSGCSHKGILNIAEWFAPDVLVGGFHFMKLDTEKEKDRKVLELAAGKMLEGFTGYYTGHCTGEKQYDYLKKLMGERLGYAAAGAEIII